MRALEGPPRISVIIPAFNEERYLPRLLDSLRVAGDAYGRGVHAIEVIVADNSSTDRTAEVARSLGCRLVTVVNRTIAATRNGGARVAQGEVLAFVDADTVRVHPDTFSAIDRALEDGCVGGATGVTPERWSLGIAVTFGLVVPLVWMTGMDTGVVFCRRADFVAVGGYDERRYFAEDVAFLVALRRHGRATARKLTRVTSVKAVASTRKFDEFGDWHYLTWAPRAAVHAWRGAGVCHPGLHRYWYRPSR